MKFNLIPVILALIALPCNAQTLEKITWDENDAFSGYYLAVRPASEQVEGVLFLMPGFGQLPESIFPETKLHNVAFSNDILTIGFSAGPKLYLDDEIREKIITVMQDVKTRYKVGPDKFVLGGYSSGGALVLRFAEMSLERPDEFPIEPIGVFMVDSPIDIFSLWDGLEEIKENNNSETAVQEAEYVMRIIEEDYGVPSENIDVYSPMNPFSMDKDFGQNEKYLQDIAVRAYHDVDIAWRLYNRNQSAKRRNFTVTSELINRLLLLGNDKAEFIQAYKTGYRSNGQRHPHSWSIVDEVECIMWMKRLLEEK